MKIHFEMECNTQNGQYNVCFYDMDKSSNPIALSDVVQLIEKLLAHLKEKNDLQALPSESMVIDKWRWN